MLMEFATPHGDYYKVDLETGNMTASDNKSFSGQWKFVGFSHVKRNATIRLSTIRSNPDVLKKIDFLWKNGNPQWTIIDLDHGSTRIWGNTKYHGVCRAYLIKD